MTNILTLTDPSALRFLPPSMYGSRFFTNEEFDHIFRLRDALWLHSGNPADPHAVTTQGQCTNGFVDTLRVLCVTPLCEIFGMQLAMKVREIYGGPIDWVIGSDHAGAAISHSAAITFRAQHDFTEKDPTPKSKKQFWKRFVIGPHEIVLRTEELITTTGTLERVTEGIREGNPTPVMFAPVIATLIHRSSVWELEGAPICYLRHYDISTWDKENCPLCAQGSERIEKPKQNWARLTGKAA